MATNTPNYNLAKPDGSEVPDISVINSNMDKIDSRMKITSDAMAALASRTAALEGVQSVTWNSDDRIWHSKPNGAYVVSTAGLGYPGDYGIIFHAASPGGVLAQIFISFAGLTRVRFANPNQNFSWQAIK